MENQRIWIPVSAQLTALSVQHWIPFGNLTYIYIYGLVFRVPTHPNGLRPQVAPRSLLFASYWQHF